MTASNPNAQPALAASRNVFPLKSARARAERARPGKRYCAQVHRFGVFWKSPPLPPSLIFALPAKKPQFHTIMEIELLTNIAQNILRMS
jgi:hypothetical protein